jgi:hypothetical protein
VLFATSFVASIALPAFSLTDSIALSTPVTTGLTSLASGPTAAAAATVFEEAGIFSGALTKRTVLTNSSFTLSEVYGLLQI